MAKVIIPKPPKKWEGPERTTFLPKDSMISKDKELFSVFSGGCLPCILVYKPEIDPNVFSGAIFHRENDPEKGNDILVWKAEKGPEDCQSRTSLRDAECFIPLLEQLTMNAIRISTTKYSKAIVLQRWMNQNLYSTLPLNTSKMQEINIWTKKFPSGKNEVGKPLLKATQNYSVGKACISKVLDSDVLVIV